MTKLFDTLKLRDIEFRNRVFVSPMCQYSAADGAPTDWHFVHLGTRAVGGAGLVLTEAAAVCPEGRITPDDAGIWNDAHTEGWSRVTRFVKEQGARVGIQLAHAGRKASTQAPWLGDGALSPSERGWQPIGPSAMAFSDTSPVPRAMNPSDIDRVVAQFVDATQRSLEAGFEVVELHAAHGYLLHQFLSPLSNHRRDDYGGSLENRMRLPLRVARAVRAAWPERLPLFVRLSTTDWTDGGWDLPQSIEFSRALKGLGVDLIDCSSGGLVPNANVPVGPGYQVAFAEAIRREAALPTAAVGMITKPEQADEIVAGGKADAVLLGRQLLRDPYWPLHAAKALGAPPNWPKQYRRAG